MAGNTEETSAVSAEDIQTARQLLGCGIPVRRVAAQFAIPDQELRQILGLPARQQATRQQSPWWQGVLQ